MAMTVLVTGASGFVGPYAIAALRRTLDPDTVIVATSRVPTTLPDLGHVHALDVTDESSIRAALERHRPTQVLHLAGIATTGPEANPGAYRRVHVDGTLNLARAIVSCVPECVLIHVSSGLVYGETGRNGYPLAEDAPLAPVGDYAASKAAADTALGALAEKDLRCLRLRPFNHSGPGQSEYFVLPAFAAQIARIEAGLASPVIKVGTLNAERDFLDVRDVADAYALAVRDSEVVRSGEIFNIASGQPRRIADLLHDLVSLSAVPIRIEQDPSRMRPDEIPRIVGDSNKFRLRFGWTPVRDFRRTLLEVLAGWRSAVSAGPMTE